MKKFLKIIIALIILITAFPTKSKAENDKSIVLAGGCFWGIQEVFSHVKGVKKTTSGYAGGNAKNAKYVLVSGGDTGHAEAVEVVYDPSQISLEKILQVFFLAAHNPTELNRQGPDYGTQYRSAIFYSNAAQKEEARKYIKNLDKTKIFSIPIATKLESLKKFYPAEDYHQNYAKKHPKNPYIVANDLPKVAVLKSKFPEIYK
jgi:peptide-methionine (S)-S-oxide reductase